ncbi:small nuclear ribonucleoprotein E-like [Lolium rigidum]|uniref:small nuclear ribonucleoprotein E-like n=1 Tax=Lolium rigidum TaxID=89674 RepID=UPI001F5D9961|nr:small nuclear ribonucleoprotein E-like [Lolium rigidum]
MASTKVQRIMTQPINLIFRFLQSKARIQIWLFEQKDMRIEGRIIVSSFADFLPKLAEFSPINPSACVRVYVNSNVTAS